MSKAWNRAFCALLIVFIAALFCINLVSPDREFSDMENRVLAQKPAFSFSALFSGKWTAAYETYLTDQFSFRDSWVAMKYLCERALLKKENNGIYFADNGMLISRFDAPKKERVDKNFEAVEALAQSSGLPTRLMLVPTAAYVYRDALPKNAPSYDQQKLLDRAAGLQNASYVDVSAVLKEHRGDALYYRTDHHWTTSGAYLAYCAYMNALGRGEEIVSRETLEGLKKELPDFYGTLYSQSGARFIKPDTITYYDFPGVTMQQPEKQPVSIYDLSFAEKKDKYAVFFGGNPPLFTIKSQAPGAHGKLMVIKDSFANSLLPYLSQNFAEIEVFDPRYNRQSAAEAAKAFGADQILVLYQTANFASDVNIGLLGA